MECPLRNNARVRGSWMTYICTTKSNTTVNKKGVLKICCNHNKQKQSTSVTITRHFTPPTQ